jgi:predicted transcriptional regulator
MKEKLVRSIMVPVEEYPCIPETHTLREAITAKEYLIPIKATVDYDDHIMKAMCEMVDENTSLLPVVRNESVVGIVRSVDVLNEIAQILGP